jgi:monoamine oxidase
MDAIIVGAGAAGLAAAAALDRAGADFVVLEARARVGGRVWTLRHDATPLAIELGAEFVHGAAQRTERLAAAAGHVVADIAGDDFRARDGRFTPLDDFFPRVGKVLRLLDAEREPDRSFGEFLRARRGGKRLARERTLARSFVQGFHAADIERIGERSLARTPNPGDDASAARHGRLVAGYGPLLAHVAAGVADRIRFGSVVERIVWRPGSVTVHAARETLEARATIVTVPLPLLQARALAIEPEPPALRRALDGLIMGSVVRVTFVFRERFWEGDFVPAAAAGATGRRIALDRLGFLHTPHAPFNIWWTAHPLRAPLITGWAGGPAARRLAAAGDVEGAAIRTLARALGVTPRRLENRIDATFTHDWDADPFSRGAYAYAAVGGESAAAALARPVRRTLYLAGEATSARDGGTVEGALESGERAARQVVR